MDLQQQQTRRRPGHHQEWEACNFSVNPQDDQVDEERINSEEKVRPANPSKKRRRRKAPKAASLAPARLILLFLGSIAFGFVVIFAHLTRMEVTNDVAKHDSAWRLLRRLDRSSSPNDNAPDRHEDAPAPIEGPTFRVRTDEAPPCTTQLEPSEIDYTLVTQTSHDRLWMLSHHCARWGHGNPVSVAVFTDLSKDEIGTELTDMGCHPGQISVRTLSTAGYPASEYPVNILRNMALSAVRTSHVFYVDVDFWVGSKVHDILSIDWVREEFAADPKFAAVVPAFSTVRQCGDDEDCRDANVAVMPSNKAELQTLLDERLAAPFDVKNRGGHGSTQYAQWLVQKPGDFWDVRCIHSNRYEPYMVYRYCEDLPPFQEQFTGYGKNKITMIMQMRRSGYLFSQLGDAFLMHYPHRVSKAKGEWDKAGQKTKKFKKEELRLMDLTVYKRGRVDKLFKQFKIWMEDEIPDESRMAQCDDFNDDDSKLWVNDLS